MSVMTVRQAWEDNPNCEFRINEYGSVITRIDRESDRMYRLFADIWTDGLRVHSDHELYYTGDPTPRPGSVRIAYENWRKDHPSSQPRKVREVPRKTYFRGKARTICLTAKGERAVDLILAEERKRGL